MITLLPVIPKAQRRPFSGFMASRRPLMRNDSDPSRRPGKKLPNATGNRELRAPGGGSLETPATTAKKKIPTVTTNRPLDSRLSPPDMALAEALSARLLQQRQNAQQSGGSGPSARAALETLWNVDDSSEESASDTKSVIPDGKERQRVTFADEKGQVLHVVQEYSAEDLEDPTDERVCNSGAEDGRLFTLVQNFESPKTDYCTFFERLDTQHVALESAATAHCMITGQIQTRNVPDDKQVFVRYTTNNWENHQDVNASVMTSVGNHETYKFELSVDTSDMRRDINTVLLLKICCENEKTQFWDTNEELCYSFDIAPLEKAPTESPTEAESVEDAEDERMMDKFAFLRDKIDGVEKRRYTEQHKGR